MGEQTFSTSNMEEFPRFGRSPFLPPVFVLQILPYFAGLSCWVVVWKQEDTVSYYEAWMLVRKYGMILKQFSMLLTSILRYNSGNWEATLVEKCLVLLLDVTTAHTPYAWNYREVATRDSPHSKWNLDCACWKWRWAPAYSPKIRRRKELFPLHLTKWTNFLKLQQVSKYEKLSI